MKVLFLTVAPSPYRVDFFNELGKYCNLTVLYENKSLIHRNKNWAKENEGSFNEVYLKRYVFKRKGICPSVISYVRDKSYNVVIIGGYSTFTEMLAIEYMRLTKKPFVLSVDGGFIKEESMINKVIKKHFVRCASEWLSTGNETSKYLIHYGAKENKIHYYPFTSIRDHDIITKPTETNEKNILKEKLDLKEEKVVIAVGQFIYRKGFDLLLKASTTLPKNVGVYLVGGKTSEELLNLKEELNLENVHFIDFKKKHELFEYFKAADVLAMPTREDIWGLVINEAMANGLPIITTEKCIAGVELIKNGVNGYIVPINDEDALDEKLNKILSDSNLQNKMAAENLHKIQEYTIENMAKVHFNIINTIIEERALRSEYATSK